MISTEYFESVLVFQDVELGTCGAVACTVAVLYCENVLYKGYLLVLQKSLLNTL